MWYRWADDRLHHHAPIVLVIEGVQDPEGGLVFHKVRTFLMS